MRATLLLAALLCATASLQAAARLSPEPLAGTGSSFIWEGQQYLQADQKGRVYLLRAPELEVYPIQRNGELGKPVKLKTASRNDTPLVQAALSPDGRDWLLLSFGVSKKLRYFPGGEEKMVSGVEAWNVASAGLPGGTIVAGVKAGQKASAVAVPVPDTPPLLLRWTGTKWETLVSEPLDFAAVSADPDNPVFNQQLIKALEASRESLLANGRKGSLWMASRHTYRLRHFSAGGRLLTDLRLGKQKVEIVDRTPEELRSAKAAAKEAKPGQRRLAESILSAPAARKAIDTFTVAPDGVVYLVTSSMTEGKGAALDRFDPARGALERAEIQLPASEGRLQIAAGQDGLYFAGGTGAAGRWRLSWEALADAEWEEVAEAKIEVHRQ